MAKTTLTGTVTRLIPADESRGIGPQVYFLPAEANARRWIDGKHQAASGEIHVFGDIAQYKVGAECTVVYDPDEPGTPPKLQAAAMVLDDDQGDDQHPVG